MKILVYNDISCHVGGAETFAYNLMEGAQDRGHELKFISFHSKPLSRKRLKDKVYYVACNQIKYPRIQKAFSRFVREFKPDVIHCHNNYYYTSSICDAIVKCGIPAVATIHDYDLISPFFTPSNSPLLELKRRQFRRIMKASQRITSPTRKLIHELSFLDKEKFSYLPLYVDLNCWKYNPHTYKNPPRISFLGRLIEDKGIYILLEAFRLLSKEFPDAELVYIGKGNQEENLRKKIQAYGLEKRIELSGYISLKKVHKIMHSSRIHVLSSIYEELFGLVGIEAQAIGLPVLAADVGGVSEWCKEGETGYLYEAQNPKILAKKLAQLLRHPLEGKRIAHNAYQHIRQEYHKEKSIELLLSTYKESINA
ncbi:MAG: glycosyltransferase family 4 protein [Bacteroidota bacterium]